MAEYDLIVVGGGISGLTLAHHAVRDGMKVLLLEREGRTGGCFNTLREKDGFFLELGAHTCYNTYAELIGLIEECGLVCDILPRNRVPYKIYADGKTQSLRSALGLMEFAFSSLKLFALTKQGRTVKSYYSSIAGKGNYGRLVGPAISAVICQNADDVPADMVFKSRPKRKDFVRSFTFTGGLGAFTDFMAKEVEVRRFADVRAITTIGKVFVVKTAEGETFESLALAIATPPVTAAGLMQEIAPEVAGNLARIHGATVDSLGVIARAEKVAMEKIGVLISPADCFYSVVSRDVLDDAHHRGFTFHFRPGTDEQTRIDTAQRVLGLNRGDIEHLASGRSDMPMLRVGHAKLIGEIDSALAGRRILLCGNYFGGMAIEDCVVRAGAEYERLRRTP